VGENVSAFEKFVGDGGMVRVLPLSPVGCTVRGHSEHLFGDMVDTYN